MLKNAYFLAKIGADTAENEQHFAEILPIGLPEGSLLRELRVVRPGRPIGKISAKCCSCSAVSAPIFARKYAFCSIFQNLPDDLADIF